MNVVTTSRPILETLTDRELYRLAFEVSEILTEREMIRQYGIREPVAYEPIRTTPVRYVPDSADDNYGAW